MAMKSTKYVFKSTIPFNQMRCFQNDSININLTGQACDYWSLIGVDEYHTTALNVFPNPTDGTIQLTHNENIQQLEVFDATGQLILSLPGSASAIQLPAESGIYFLGVTWKNGHQSFEKIIRK